MDLVVLLHRLGQLLAESALGKESQVGLVVVFMTVENVLKIYGFVRNVQGHRNDSHQVMQLGRLELGRRSLGLGVLRVESGRDESEFGGHGEVGDGDVESFVDFAERSQLFPEPLPVVGLGSSHRKDLHDAPDRELLQLLDLPVVEKVAAEFYFLLEHPDRLLGLVHEPLQVLVDVGHLVLEVLDVPQLQQHRPLQLVVVPHPQESLVLVLLLADLLQNVQTPGRSVERVLMPLELRVDRAEL